MDDDRNPRGGLEVYDAHVGRGGQFRVEGLVPGRKYEASAVQGCRWIGELYREVTVAPGEVRNLGDLRVIRPTGILGRELPPRP